jgi:hypothetical protein
MRIMVSEPISMVYFINPSHQSVCLHVYPPIVARQRLVKYVPVAKEEFLKASLCDLLPVCMFVCPFIPAK